MKVAVTSGGPELTSFIGSRFERARYFVIYDSESEKCTVCDLRKALVPTFDAVVTGRIGRKALHTYRAANVVVYVGATGTVSDAIEAFKADELPCAVEAEAVQT